MWLVIMYFCGLSGRSGRCVLHSPPWEVKDSIRLHLCVSVSRWRFSWWCWITAPFAPPPLSILWAEWAGSCVLLWAPVQCVTTWAHGVETTGSWARTWLYTHFLSAGVPVWQYYCLLQTMLIKQGQILCGNDVCLCNPVRHIICWWFNSKCDIIQYVIRDYWGFPQLILTVMRRILLERQQFHL